MKLSKRKQKTNLKKTRNKKNFSKPYTPKSIIKGGAAAYYSIDEIFKEYANEIISITGGPSIYKSIFRTTTLEAPQLGITDDIPNKIIKQKITQVQQKLFCWIKDNVPGSIVEMKKGTIFCRTVSRVELKQLNVIGMEPDIPGQFEPAKPGTFANTSCCANIGVNVSIPLDAVMFLKTNRDLIYLNLIPFLHLLQMNYKDRENRKPTGGGGAWEGLSTNTREWVYSPILKKLGIDGIIQFDNVEDVNPRNSPYSNRDIFFSSTSVSNSYRYTKCDVGHKYFQTAAELADNNSNQVFCGYDITTGAPTSFSDNGIFWFPEFLTYNYEEQVNWEIIKLEDELVKIAQKQAELVGEASDLDEESAKLGEFVGGSNILNLFYNCTRSDREWSTCLKELNKYYLDIGLENIDRTPNENYIIENYLGIGVKDKDINDISGSEHWREWNEATGKADGPALTKDKRNKKFVKKATDIWYTFSKKKQKLHLYSLDIYNNETLVKLFLSNTSDISREKNIFQINQKSDLKPYQNYVEYIKPTYDSFLGLTDKMGPIQFEDWSQKGIGWLSFYHMIGPLYNSLETSFFRQNIELLKKFKRDMCGKTELCESNTLCCDVSDIQCEEKGADFTLVKGDATNNFYSVEQFDEFVRQITTYLQETLILNDNFTTIRLRYGILKVIVNNIQLENHLCNLINQVISEQPNVNKYFVPEVSNDNILQFSKRILNYGILDLGEILSTPEQRNLKLVQQKIEIFLLSFYNAYFSIKSDEPIQFVQHLFSDKKEAIPEQNDNRMILEKKNKILKAHVKDFANELRRKIDDLIEQANDFLDNFKEMSNIFEQFFSYNGLDIIPLFCNLYLKGGTAFKLLLQKVLREETYRNSQYPLTYPINRMSYFDEAINGKEVADERIIDLLGKPSDYDCNYVINPFLSEKDFGILHKISNQNIELFLINTAYKECAKIFKIEQEEHMKLLKDALVDNPFELDLSIDPNIKEYTTAALSYEGERINRNIDFKEFARDVKSGQIESKIPTWLITMILDDNTGMEMFESFVYYSQKSLLWATQDDNHIPTDFILHRLMLNLPSIDIKDKEGKIIPSNTDIHIELVDVSLVNQTSTERFSKWEECLGIQSDKIFGVGDDVLYQGALYVINFKYSIENKYDIIPANYNDNTRSGNGGITLEDMVSLTQKEVVGSSLNEPDIIKGWARNMQMFNFNAAIHDLVVVIMDNIRDGRVRKLPKRQKRLAILSQLYYLFIQSQFIPEKKLNIKKPFEGILSLMHFEKHADKYDYNQKLAEAGTSTPCYQFLREIYKKRVPSLSSQITLNSVENPFTSINGPYTRAFNLIGISVWDRISGFLNPLFQIMRTKLENEVMDELTPEQKQAIINQVWNAQWNTYIIFNSIVPGNPPPLPPRCPAWTENEKTSIEDYFLNVLTLLINMEYDPISDMGLVSLRQLRYLILYHIINDTYLLLIIKIATTIIPDPSKPDDVDLKKMLNNMNITSFLGEKNSFYNFIVKNFANKIADNRNNPVVKLCVTEGQQSLLRFILKTSYGGDTPQMIFTEGTTYSMYNSADGNQETGLDITDYTLFYKDSLDYDDIKGQLRKIISGNWNRTDIVVGNPRSYWRLSEYDEYLYIQMLCCPLPGRMDDEFSQLPKSLTDSINDEWISSSGSLQHLTVTIENLYSNFFPDPKIAKTHYLPFNWTNSISISEAINLSNNGYLVSNVKITKNKDNINSAIPLGVWIDSLGSSKLLSASRNDFYRNISENLFPNKVWFTDFGQYSANRINLNNLHSHDDSALLVENPYRVNYEYIKKIDRTSNIIEKLLLGEKYFNLNKEIGKYNDSKLNDLLSKGREEFEFEMSKLTDVHRLECQTALASYQGTIRQNVTSWKNDLAQKSIGELQNLVTLMNQRIQEQQLNGGLGIVITPVEMNTVIIPTLERTLNLMNNPIAGINY
jgi:hypothetical protein